MKIKSIIIKKLYKAYSYQIDIKDDANIFIMTGPNGYGKTTILNMLYSLSSGNLLFFYFLDFLYLEFKMDNRQSLRIKKELLNQPMDDIDKEIGDERNKRVRFSIEDSKGNELAYYVLDYQLIRELIKDKDRDLGEADY